MDGAGSRLEPGDIAGRLDDLRDLFVRRLSTDRTQQKSIDVMYEQLQHAQRLAEGEYLLPLVRSIISVIDRLTAEGGILATSVRDELVEALRRSGVTQVPIEPGPWNPATAQVFNRIPVEAPEQAGIILSVARQGWCFGERIIRPALVDVGHHAASAERSPSGDRI